MEKTVYLMRALPSCGKSFTARRLAGATGVVCETDEYFYTHAGTDPARYDYDATLLPSARRWNLERFRDAVVAGVSPIVVDRGNGRNVETYEYIELAFQHGYHVELKEPESPWWQEIRVLLAQKEMAWPRLCKWADQLAALSASTHRVPAATIRDWMASWRPNLTVEEIVQHVTSVSP